MVFCLGNVSKASGATVSMRCPACRQIGTFEPAGQDLSWTREGKAGTLDFGQRVCPNPKCRAHVFFVYDARESRLLETYPAERIDFDASNIPSAILTTLEESITCHANKCFVAAAIMIRRTLEELCHDRGATGKILKDRIRDLGTKIVIPKELLDGLDDLRLLGNDAAHIESQEYHQVGKEEVEVGIEFTKEVLKAVFQYSDLLGRLRGLRKTTDRNGDEG